MKALLRWNDLVSALLSLLLLLGGGVLIRVKLNDNSSIQDDQILTVEEQRALPADVMPVVIMRTPWYNEQSLPYGYLE